MNIDNEMVMCDGGNCLLRYHCHRFTKRSFINPELSFIDAPHEDNLEDCEFLWNDNAENLWIGLNRLTNPTN